MTIEQINAQLAVPSKRNRKVFIFHRNPSTQELNALPPQAQQILAIIKRESPIMRAKVLKCMYNEIRTKTCVSRLLSLYTRPLTALGMVELKDLTVTDED